MGSKKRAAWSKAKSEFLSAATGGDMSDLFAREDERRDALDSERDEAWRYKSCAVSYTHLTLPTTPYV